jgi:manganese transport protein
MPHRIKKLIPRLGELDILKYIGPGFIVTAGFIDPGNWAANIAAGSRFGYSLLWVVTLSTIMLVILQHNAAHLGIATGLCISEAITKYFRSWLGRFLVGTAIIASISTALAEFLGAAIGLNMLFHVPINIGAALSAGFAVFMLLTNSYRKLERWIIGFVSIIGLSFIYELTLCRIDWPAVATSAVLPSIPLGSTILVMSILGAVVMPHNLFLHSEVIQSRHWNIEDQATISRQMKYEFTDTLVAMMTGWAINGSMIIMAAAVFFAAGTVVTELPQAEAILRPLLGDSAANVFAFALIMAGLASSITAGLAGGSIYAGLYGKPFAINEHHSRTGILVTLVGALLAIFFIGDPFNGLIWSQVILSIQLPFTIFALLFLTSSKTVMGKRANSLLDKILIWTFGLIVICLNVLLIKHIFFGE